MSNETNLTTNRVSRLTIGDDGMDRYYTAVKLADKDKLTGEQRDLFLFTVGYLEHRRQVDNIN